MQPIISVSELASKLQTQALSVVRAVMDDPVTKTQDNRQAMVIANTVDIDLDAEGSDHTTGFPHSMPNAHDFALYLGRLGLTYERPIVVYDTRGIYSAPRVWWMLKAMGHKDVCVLNGGQVAWEESNYPVSQPQTPTHLTYTPSPESAFFVNSSAVLEALDSNTQLIDARSEARFFGEVEEPRPGVRSGHMPGAINLPFATLLKDGQFLSAPLLMQIFEEAGVDLSRPIICTCGSGVTACIVGMAAIMCNAKQVSVYDGSWSQWGADLQFPVTTERK